MKKESIKAWKLSLLFSLVFTLVQVLLLAFFFHLRVDAPATKDSLLGFFILFLVNWGMFRGMIDVARKHL